VPHRSCKNEISIENPPFWWYYISRKKVSKVNHVNGSYKYKPEDFNGILNLPDGFRDFYRFLEIYQENKSRLNWFEFRRC